MHPTAGFGGPLLSSNATPPETRGGSWLDAGAWGGKRRASPFPASLPAFALFGAVTNRSNRAAPRQTMEESPRCPAEAGLCPGSVASQKQKKRTGGGPRRFASASTFRRREPPRVRRPGDQSDFRTRDSRFVCRLFSLFKWFHPGASSVGTGNSG